MERASWQKLGLGEMSGAPFGVGAPDCKEEARLTERCGPQDELEPNDS